MTDKRKKENPKNHLLGFKTDLKTMTRIKDEAKRKEFLYLSISMTN